MSQIDKIRNLTNLSMVMKVPSKIVKNRRIQFTGLNLRLPENRHARIAFKWVPKNGKQPSGHPEKTWRSTVLQVLRQHGINWYQALDRFTPLKHKVVRNDKNLS